jgi:hypothetical protein
MADSVAVKFTRMLLPYAAGEVASFSRARAEALVKNKFADYVDALEAQAAVPVPATLGDGRLADVAPERSKAK